MGLIEIGTELYYSLFKISIVFTFTFIILSNIFNFVDLSEIPIIKWDFADLNSAISALSNARGLDIAVAIPTLIVKIFALMILSFVNSILFLRFLIESFINIIIILVGIETTTATNLSNIISWIVIFPALIGIISDIGRVIFYMLFGIKR